MTYLAVQVGAAGGSAHGGASPPAYSAGSGCPPGPKARVSPGRLLRFLPPPSPSLRPVLPTSLIFSLQGRFPPLRVLRFLPLPSPSFRPVLSGSLHSRPLRSPAVFPPTRRSDSFPVLLPDPGFRRPSFGARFLWPAGRAEAPPHHSTGAAKVTGMVQTLKSLLYPSFEASQSTGNGGLMVLTSCENQALWSCLRRSIRRLRRSSSDAVSDDSSARLAKTPASIK